MKLDPEIAATQWNRFVWSRDRGHLEFINKADACDKFFAGEQWQQSDLDTLRAQRRPALTINKILPTLASVMGEQIMNSAEVLFRPASGSPPEVAEALTRVWMQLAQENQLPWLREDMFADGIIRSRGFLDMRIDFGDSMRGEVKITNLNSKNVIVDPDAEEYDPDAWNDVFITKWLTPQDVGVIYNEEAAEYLKSDAASSYPYGYDSIERVRDRFAGSQLQAAYYGLLDPDGIRRNVRVLDRQHRKLDKQLHFVDTQTGDMRPVPSDWDRNRIADLLAKTGGRLSTTKKLVKRIRWTVTAGTVILHDEWSPYKHFTVVPYFPYFRYGRTIGLVENLMGPQEMLNKVSSQELHVINTTANSGWKIKAGSLVNMSIEELEQAGATTGLVLELDDVHSAEKIQPNQTPSGLDRLSYKAEEHIKGISNVSDSMQGFDRADVAAKSTLYKTQRGSINFSKIFSNLERTDYILARNGLDLIQQYYTEERIITITHSDATKASEESTINQRDPVTGEITNDLTLGEYHIVITSQPQRDSLEDTQFDQALNLRKEGVNVPDNVLIENSKLTGKADILKAMNSPEMQEQAELKTRLQKAEVALAEAQAQDKSADSALKNARMQGELQRIQQGGDLAGQEPQKDPRADLEMEQQMMQQKHALEIEKMEREYALRTKQLDQEMAFKEREHAQKLQLEQQQAADKARQEEAQAQQDRVNSARAAQHATTQGE